MKDVFISYAREDRGRIERLVDILVAERGWSVWFDVELRGGEQFPRAIQDAIRDARCVVVVWSRHSVESNWVIAEASEGWERGVLVPLRLDDAVPPMPFRQTEAVDFSSWNRSGRAAPVLELVEVIERAMQRGPPAAEDELVAREARRHEFRRRRLARLAIAGVAAVAVVAAAWFGTNWLATRADAERIADRAAALRSEVLQLSDEERTKTWGSALLDDDERLDHLQVATLLAAEAFQRASTARTRAVLSDMLALSPWSEHYRESENEVHELKFSADGTSLISSGGQDDTILWDFRSDSILPIAHGGMGGRERWEDQRGERTWRDEPTVDVDVTGAKLATGGPDETAMVWDANSGTEIARLAHESVVTAVAFGDTDRLATLTENGVVRLWDLSTGRELWRAEQGGASYWLAFSPSHRYLLSTSGSVARLFDPAKGEQLARLEHEGPVGAGRFNAAETLLATFGDEIDTRVFDLPSATERLRIPVASDERAGAVFVPDGSAIVIGTTEGNLRWWNLQQNAEQFSVSIGSYVLEMESSASGERFVAAGDDSARAFDTASGRELRQMPYPYRLHAATISSDGRLIATSGWDYNGFGVEVTEVTPADPVAMVCAKARRNLTRDEWRDNVGPVETYRATCPMLEEE